MGRLRLTILGQSKGEALQRMIRAEAMDGSNG